MPTNYEQITEEIAKVQEEKNKGTGKFTQIRSARLRQFQDPVNHKDHQIVMIDLDNDKQYDIPYCQDCQTVLMDPLTH